MSGKWQGKTWGSGGRKAGKKGKGEKGGWQEHGWGRKGGDAWQEDWAEDWANADGEASSERTGRIKTNFQFAKSILRASANKDGSCFVKPPKSQMPDNKFLSRSTLLKSITTENSHLVRRPGTGISEVAGSVKSGAAVLAHMTAHPEDVGFPALLKMFREEGVQEAMEALDRSSGDERERKDLQEALKIVKDWTAKHGDELLDVVAKTTIASSRLYLMSSSLLQLLALSSKPQTWASQIPSGSTEHPSLNAWKEDPKNVDKMSKALAVLCFEKQEKDAEWQGGGNAAEDLFTKKRGKPAQVSDDESAAPPRKKSHRRKDSSSEDDGKKAGKKVDKKEKHEKKTKKGKDKSSSSDSSSAKKKRPEKKPKGKRSSSESSDSSNKKKEGRKRGVKKDTEKKKKDKKETKGRSSDASDSSQGARAEGKGKGKDSGHKILSELEVAFTTWKLSDVQAFEAEMETLLTTIGKDKDGTYPTAPLQELAAKIPEAVLAEQPALKSRFDMKDQEKISNTDARALVQRLVDLANQATTFYENQSEPAASATASGGAAADAAKGRRGT